MKNHLFSFFALFSATAAMAQFSPYNDIVTGDIHAARQIIPIDFDLDGDMDIITRSNYHISFFENTGSGEFEYPEDLDVTGLATVSIDFAVVDFDSDGDLDVMVSNLGDTPSFLKNNGDGTFAEITIVELTNLTKFEAIDFDADGDIDIVGISAGEMIWFEGDGTGVIIDEHVLEVLDIEATDFVIADTDNDSDLDIAWFSGWDGGAIYFMENLGGGIFDDRIIVESGLSNPSSLCASDIDGDLDLDLVYGSWTDGDEGLIHWSKNMGDGTFSSGVLIGDGYSGQVFVNEGDIDLDGDQDLIVGSRFDNLVVWYENTGVETFETPSIMSNSINWVYGVSLGDFDGDGDLDAYTHGLSSDQIGWFENGMLNPSHVEGQIYYDENENGVRDIGEIGMPWAIMKSDPDGTMAVTNLDGSYSISFEGLADGDYEIFPELVDWMVTSAHDTYDVTVEDDMTFMDTLDFGMYPIDGVDSIGTDIAGTPELRCNSIRPIWISVNNLGTTFPTGIMHLELDDSLTYEWAGVVPDSIVGQNLYWSYETFFFFESETFMVHVSTPDGVDDTVTSILTSTVIIDDAAVFTATDVITQPINCAYDPNDKTPDPLGEGPEGNIPTSTQWIEYTVRFQNTGTAYAEDVIIRDQLDEDLIWTSIQPLYSSHDMELEFDPSGEVSFVFDNIMLPDSNASEVESHGFVKYRIQMQPDLALGTTIENTAHIYFDYNPAVLTNTALNTIAEEGNATITEVNEDMTVSVYPNPAADFAYVYLDTESGVEYTIRLFNTVGQSVYLKENVASGQSTISTSELDNGMYILVIESATDGAKVFTTKLIVE